MNLDAGRLVAINVRVLDTVPSLLDDEGHIKAFFRALIEQIRMIPLREPEAVRVPPSIASVMDDHADDGGLTVQCIISTSHIAYHSWPLQNRFRLVVDSCKDFSAEDVMAVVRSRFPVKELSVQDLPYMPPIEGYDVRLNYSGTDDEQETQAEAS